MVQVTHLSPTPNSKQPRAVVDPVSPTSPNKVDLLLSAKVTSPQSMRISKFETAGAGVPKNAVSDRTIVGRRLWYIPDDEEGGELTPEDYEKKYPYMVHPASDFRRR